MTISYLGANRGIGLGLVIELAKRSDVKIYATVRDPSKATDLQAVADKHSNVSILTWRADKTEDSTQVARVIEKEVGHLDVLIANAGVFSDPTPVLTTTSETFIHDFTVNAAGPLHLFQATAGLLEKSSKAGGGVWAPISSCLGSIAEHPDMHALAYGASKAALNFTSKRISKEHKKIKVIIIHPGDVRTEMAQGVAKKAGFDEIPGTITVEESASQIVALTERSDKFDTGIFVDYKGDGMAW